MRNPEVPTSSGRSNEGCPQIFGSDGLGGPILVSACDAASLCGVSARTWWRLDSAGKVPQAVRLGGRKLWRLAELRDWTAANCPPRSEWTWAPK